MKLVLALGYANRRTGPHVSGLEWALRFSPFDARGLGMELPYGILRPPTETASKTPPPNSAAPAAPGGSGGRPAGSAL